MNQTAPQQQNTKGVLKAEALFQSIWNQHSRPIFQLTLCQQGLNRTVDFLNRNNLAFW